MPVAILGAFRDRLLPSTLLVALAVTLGAVEARAQKAGNLTGNDLLTLCGKPTGEYFCSGYVTGVVDYDRALMEGLNFNPNFCIPVDATPQQLADITIAYLQNNLTRRADKATSGIVHAMREAFPCR